MRNWIHYSVVPTLRRRVEKAQIWVAWHVPKWLAYWCTIRVGVHATAGPYSGEEVPGVKLPDMLKRWEK
jgi:hypothetical protein